MNVFEDALEVVAAFGAGLVAGGQIFIIMVAVPAMRSADNALSLTLHQVLFSEDVPDRYLVPCALTAFVASAILLAIGDHDAVIVALTAVAMAAIAATAVVSETINRPLNHRLRAFAGNSDDYPPLRERWIRFHGVRVLLGSVAFVALATRMVL